MNPTKINTDPYLYLGLCTVEDAGASDTPAAGGGGAADPPAGDDATLLGGDAAKDAPKADDKPAAADPAQRQGAFAGKAEEKPADKVEGEAKEGDKPAKTEAELAADKAAAEAPFELKTPEGFAAMDEAALKAAAPILRGLGVTTNEQAQAAIDAFAKDVLPGMVAQAVTQANEATLTQAATMRKEWLAQTRADKDIAPTPEALAANVEAAKLFRDRFDKGGELRQLMNDSGIGDHPAMMRFMVAASRAISEGAFHVSDGGGANKQTASQRMYGPEFQPKT